MGLDPKTIIFDPWNLIYHYNLRGIVDVGFFSHFCVIFNGPRFLLFKSRQSTKTKYKWHFYYN